ncbi:thioesterase II family protein [Streptomyces sp. P1-3]|uniref:thioesterase II family protein n=1 Tax=Streptomyces sp. P1-3 TaxID=3421658 RepID=UPI003D36E78D
MSSEYQEKTTLVCVPFAGAGPSFFHPWRALTSDGCRVVTVDLPGRERRLLETPYRNVYEAACGTVDDVVAAAGEGARVVFFGHSLGAVLAYELAHLLSKRHEVTVERLFVSGSPGPWTQRARRATGLPDEEFLARVEVFAGFRHEALDHPEMRELVLPTLRADCEMHENYTPSTDEPLSIPICSIRGTTDDLVDAELAREWRKATVDEFTFTEMPGGHMYLVDHAEELVRLIEAGSGG